VLLIDQNSHAQSISPHDVAVPFVREWFAHDVTGARAFLDWQPHDLAFVTAVVEELRRCLAAPENNLPYPHALIEAAARAIADGLIGVASALPDNATLSFDSGGPSAPYGPGAIMFGNPQAAEAFVLTALRTPKHQAAFADALRHPIAARQGQGDRQSGGAPLHLRVAGLLLTRQLALLPWSGSRQTLRLVWAEHAVPPAPPAAAAAAPPPQAAAPPPPPPPPPQNTVPVAPADVSPQAQALIDAAQDGAPFCEECARRAAAEAAANG
jgi:hypothetical protein